MIETHVDLKPYNTFGISSFCKQFGRFNSSQELIELLDQVDTKSLLILGGGSNLLLTKNFDGTVLKNEITGIDVTEENDTHVIIRAGAGVVWHDLVLHCIANNWGGIENLSLIPGSVGASPMQNIGAYGVEIKDIFYSLEAMHLETREIHTFDLESCEFGYRESVFKRKYKGQYVILSVSYRLQKTHTTNTSYGAINEQLKANGINNPSIQDVSNAVIAIRQSKLPNPKELGNAGSFFKNPVVPQARVEAILQSYPEAPNYPAEQGYRKLAAGWLIEQAGWKGLTRSTHGVHAKQALVLVNYGGATGQEIYQLSADIITDIQTKFNVTLEREVNIL